MYINRFLNVYRVLKNHTVRVFYQHFRKQTGYDKENTKVLGDGLDDARCGPLPFLGEGRDLDGVHCVGG